MAEDFEQTRLGWFSSGLQLAEQYGQGVRLSLAKQQQKSAEAERASRERELNARLSQIDLENQKLTDSIRQKAAEDAEWLQTVGGLKKSQMAFQAARTEGDQSPEPDWMEVAVQQAAQIPHNPNAQKLLTVAADLESRKALTQQRSDSTRLREEALNFRESAQESLDKLRDAQTELTEERRLQVKKGGPSTQTVTQKDYAAYIEAQTRGDKTGVRVFGEKLGLNELPYAKRVLLNQLLKMEASSVEAELRPKNVQTRMEAIINRFMAPDAVEGTDDDGEELPLPTPKRQAAPAPAAPKVRTYNPALRQLK